MTVAVAAVGGDDTKLPTQTVTGLLLCRAADHRMAFLAEHVSAIELFAEGLAPHVGALLGADGSKGKVLRHASGAGVGVDAVEVHSDSAELLPSPRLIAAGLGGSLYGFVKLQASLYPVLRLSEFARFLHTAWGPTA